MLETVLAAGFEELSIPCSKDMLDQFRRYEALLAERGAQMNLTAIRGEDEVARLHFLDCAALLTVCDLRGKRVLDVGSGAGFPGLVLRILCPEIELTLLDSLGKRVRFQQEVCDALGLSDVQCLHLRAEEAPASMRGHYDLVVSRAVARLNVLSELCMPFVRVSGTFAAMKGPAAGEELAEARRALSLLGGDTPQVIRYSVPGAEELSHTLILTEKLRPTPTSYPRRFSQIRKQPL